LVESRAGAPREDGSAHGAGTDALPVLAFGIDPDDIKATVSATREPNHAIRVNLARDQHLKRHDLTSWKNADRVRALWHR
jgi:hypothetical protein